MTVLLLTIFYFCFVWGISHISHAGRTQKVVTLEQIKASYEYAIQFKQGMQQYFETESGDRQGKQSGITLKTEVRQLNMLVHKREIHKCQHGYEY